MDYPAGTLIHFIDYTCPIQGEIHKVGLLLRADPDRATYIVLCEGKEQEWWAFMCKEEV